MEVTRPLKCAELRGSHVFENSVALSSLEHTATGNIAKIDNAGKPRHQNGGTICIFQPGLTSVIFTIVTYTKMAQYETRARRMHDQVS